MADSDYQATINLLRSIGQPSRPAMPQASQKTVTPQLDTSFGNLLKMWIKSKILGEESVLPTDKMSDLVRGQSGSQRSRVFQGTE